MSSILDALRKLEREKAVQTRTAQGHLDRESAEHELFGRRVSRDGLTIRMRPTTVAMGAAAFVVLLAVVSVGVSLFVARSTTRSGVVVRHDAPAAPAPDPGLRITTLAPHPETADDVPGPAGTAPPAGPVRADGQPAKGEAPGPPAAPPGPPGAGREPAVVSNPPQPAVAKAPPAAKAGTPQPKPASPPPVPTPEPAPSAPASIQVAAASPPAGPEPDASPSGTPKDAAPPKDPKVHPASSARAPLDMRSLPILTEGQRLRLNLPELKMNLI
ncbi:MAG: hypothetical protein JXR94_24435, partial [Candidatus Hydrogenedentes bacterium]|nr:hypothetical protein [Candidatus Hydrogenedentota bacterium]